MNYNDKTAKMVLVSYEQAILFLERNSVNRVLRVGKVLEYARDMSNGEWDTSIVKDAIVVGVDGTLLNGQHRLWAVLLSKTDQELPVVFNGDSWGDCGKWKELTK